MLFTLLSYGIGQAKAHAALVQWSSIPACHAGDVSSILICRSKVTDKALAYELQKLADWGCHLANGLSENRVLPMWEPIQETNPGKDKFRALYQ